jgi:hypothetical protein
MKLRRQALEIGIWAEGWWRRQLRAQPPTAVVTSVVAMIAAVRIVLDQHAIRPCRDRSAVTIVLRQQSL